VPPGARGERPGVTRDGLYLALPRCRQRELLRPLQQDVEFLDLPSARLQLDPLLGDGGLQGVDQLAGGGVWLTSRPTGELGNCRHTTPRVSWL
jgi:hypothetical protein